MRTEVGHLFDKPRAYSVFKMHLSVYEAAMVWFRELKISFCQWKIHRVVSVEYVISLVGDIVQKYI